MTEKTKEELEQHIQELQKEVDKLRHLIKRQKYGLVWLDVPEKFEEDSNNKIPILTEVKDKAIKNEDGKPTHVLIEGDNYHALTCLNYTHRGKVDVIYIDPPYNTGNDGFTYRDSRYMDTYPDGKPVPKDDPARHSTWLSFMSKRLKLAKNLLSDNGVIFISIDDNEIANLKLLCDDIFGNEKFIEIFNWEKTKSPSNLSNKTKERIEYIICYAKSNNKERFVGISRNLPNDNPLIKTANNISTLIFPKEKIQYLTKGNFNFSKGVYGTVKNQVRLKNDIQITDGKFKQNPILEGKFVWTQTNLDEEINKGTKIIFRGKSFAPRYIKAAYSPEVPANLIDERWGVETNDIAKNELQNLGIDKFDYPKPTSLISYLESFNGNKDSLILDFFAGSGTTLHATMKLNEEDGGHRQCILVQQKEGGNNICENVTYERNRKVMMGYTNTKGEKVEGLGNSLKYYKTDFVGKHTPANATDEDRVLLCQKAGYLLALAENTLEEMEKNSYFQLFSNGQHKLTAIYFSEDYSKIEQMKADIANREHKKTNIYMLSWGNASEFQGSFDELKKETEIKIDVKPIPQPILDIYKSIYK
jgi:adenine-specific DNA-methyltransferase